MEAPHESNKPLRVENPFYSGYDIVAGRADITFVIPNILSVVNGTDSPHPSQTAIVASRLKCFQGLSW